MRVVFSRSESGTGIQGCVSFGQDEVPGHRDHFYLSDICVGTADAGAHEGRAGRAGPGRLSGSDVLCLPEHGGHLHAESNAHADAGSRRAAADRYPELAVCTGKRDQPDRRLRTAGARHTLEYSWKQS